MQQINDLEDLLMHYVQTLYAAEAQIQKAMPDIISKVHHRSLKNALTHHASLTTQQTKRLEQAAEIIGQKRNYPPLNKHITCKGMEGILLEAGELMELKMAEPVSDSAIIGCVQKIEHYEITMYGSACAYAHELNFLDVQELLNENLIEEYDADELLTALATAAFNKEAIPDGFNENSHARDTYQSYTKPDARTAKVSINEKSIESPGGRAGTSHRGYGHGESRGH